MFQKTKLRFCIFIVHIARFTLSKSKEHNAKSWRLINLIISRKLVAMEGIGKHECSLQENYSKEVVLALAGKKLVDVFP